MSPEFFGLLERVHGHLAMLALAVLLHPVITVRRRKFLTKWTVRSADIGAAMLTTVVGLGWWLYPTYRGHVKGPLLREHLDVALRFESKEHLAVLAVALAIGGAVSLRFAGKHPDGRRAAWWLLLCGWLCGVLTACLGVFVASVAQPGW